MQYYFAERVKNPIYVLFPVLLPYCIVSAGDRRYGRNQDAMMASIRELVEERRQKGKNPEDDDDVLDMLLAEELY